MAPVLALKIDVDTDRGTRLGAPNLLASLTEFEAPGCFLFSLGPDNTGRAIRRVFRPGFFRKVSRTSVLKLYGLRTLLNGTLLPAPHVGRRNETVLRQVQQAGFEVGIHCNDHQRWQDHLFNLPLAAIRTEFALARQEFQRIFGRAARCAGAPGWQANANSRTVYDEAGLQYASDSRGSVPFFPRIGQQVFRTLEIPTTLPTLDELLGRPEFPDAHIPDHYVSLLRDDRPNVWTIHAEIEGMGKRALFHDILRAFRQRGVQCVRLDALATQALAAPAAVPIRELTMGSIDGRSGLVAVPEAAAS